jgi:hypothetical protein
LLPDEPDDSSTIAKEENVINKTLVIEKRIPQKKVAETSASSTGGTQGATYKEGGFEEGDSVLGYIHKENQRKKREHQDPYPVAPTSEGNQKITQPHDVIPQKLRIMCLDKVNGKYVIMFVPNTGGTEGVIHIDLSAESGSYPAPILSASLMGQGNLSVSDGDIKGVIFTQDVPVKLTVQLDYSDYCSMEVRAYAN